MYLLIRISDTLDRQAAGPPRSFVSGVSAGFWNSTALKMAVRKDSRSFDPADSRRWKYCRPHPRVWSAMVKDSGNGFGSGHEFVKPGLPGSLCIFSRVRILLFHVQTGPEALLKRRCRLPDLKGRILHCQDCSTAVLLRYDRNSDLTALKHGRPTLKRDLSVLSSLEETVLKQP